MAKEFRHQQQPACKPTNRQIHALIPPTKNKNLKMSNIHHSHPINQQKKKRRMSSHTRAGWTARRPAMEAKRRSIRQTLLIRAIHGHTPKTQRKIARKSQKKRSRSGKRANRRREIKMRGYCGGVDSAAAAAAVVGRGRDEGGGGGGGWVCLALYRRIWAPHSLLSPPASPVQPTLFPSAPPVGTPPRVNTPNE